MADTKEALPVVARWTGLVQAHENGGFVAYGDYLTATAAIAELRAEVERLKADAERLQGELLAQRSKLKLAEARVNTLLGRQYVTRQRD